MENTTQLSGAVSPTPGTVAHVARVTLATWLRQLACWLLLAADWVEGSEGSEGKGAVKEEVNRIQMTPVRDEDEEISVRELASDAVVVAASRERKDTINSTDSGIEDSSDLGLVGGTDEATGLELVSLEEVSWHGSREDAWLVLYDRVYEVTDYLATSRHPGGEDVILDYLGHDATLAFRSVAHSRAAFRGLQQYCVGILPPDERLNFSSDYQ